MPVKSFIIDRTANKRLAKLPLNIHEKITQAFRKLKQNPILGEKLSGKLSNYYKYRVGDYRIIYSFDSKQSLATVVKIEHRQGAYK